MLRGRSRLNSLGSFLLREPQGVLNVSEVGLDDVVELIVRGRAGAESEEDALEYLSFG